MEVGATAKRGEHILCPGSSKVIRWPEELCLKRKASTRCTASCHAIHIQENRWWEVRKAVRERVATAKQYSSVLLQSDSLMQEWSRSEREALEK